MDATTRFSNRSNAHRAARRMIDAGTAPAAEYELQVTEPDGEIEIVWATGSPSTTEQVEAEIAAASATADAPARSAGAQGLLDAAQDPLQEIELERLIAELERRGYRAAPKRGARTAVAPKERRPGKASELDQAAARGVMPEKPTVTSATNQHVQKRFDRLAELAGAGDWAAIAAYEVKGRNTYAKEVARYRDRLLAAHAAQEASAAAG